MSERLLVVREAADRLAVSTETVLRWVRAGELPAVRLPGGMIRIEPAGLELFLARHATAGAGGRAVPTTRTDRARREQPTAASVTLFPPTIPPRLAATTEED